MKKKFYLHKLGCPKNDVDADYITARLIADGHEVVEEPEEAETILVNTCGFILPAREESIEELLRLGQLKETSSLKNLYATGCLTQRSGDDMLKSMPELDGAFGHGALDSIANAVKEGKKLKKTIRKETRQLAYLSWKERFITDELPYSYLKISDGCDRTCTYCAIPGMRGKFRSRPLESIVRETEFLSANGKKEIILVSQEATLWGYDLPNRPHLTELLEAFEKIDGIEWVRLLYLYPSQVDDRLIEYLGSKSKTLPYFDLPLQHCNTEILSRMKRQVDRTQIEVLLSNIRSRVPKAVIRTTFIVGFPGETDRQFEELEDFVCEQKFERMGAFSYSREEDTPACDMSDQIPAQVAQDRLDQLMSSQHEIAVALNNSLIGKSIEVIVDSVDENKQAIGRTWADCPDVDQEVTIRGDGMSVGQICSLQVVDVDDYDLIMKGITGRNDPV